MRAKKQNGEAEWRGDPNNKITYQEKPKKKGTSIWPILIVFPIGVIIASTLWGFIR